MSDAAMREASGTAGTDAERRAALELAADLRDGGRDARVQTLWVRTAWWAPAAVAAVLGVVASVLGVGRPLAGLVVAGVALAAVLVDLMRATPLRRLTPARATQNVVSPPPASPDEAITLVLTAAVDRPRRGFAKRLPGGVLPVLVGALALVLACCVARVAGLDDRIAGALALLPTLALLVCLLALLDAAGAEPRAGDRVAVEALLGALAELDARPPRRLGVAVLFAGAGGAQSAGLRAWLRARRRRGMDPREAALVHVEPTPGEPPSWWTRDGLLVGSALHPQLVRAARRAADAHQELGAKPRTRPRGTAAGIARAAGWPAIAVGAGDPVDGAEFVLALVRALDDELAGARETAP